jgi:hypothetical protein
MTDNHTGHSADVKMHVVRDGRNCKSRSSALIFSCWTKLMISKVQHKLFSPLME